MSKEQGPDQELDMSTLWGGSASGDQAHPRAAWFRASKYAMFIHWGLYSQAANVWQGKTWHGIAEWLMRRARILVRNGEVGLGGSLSLTLRGLDLIQWAWPNDYTQHTPA